MAAYKKIDEKPWMDFGKSILAVKGATKQREFLLACQAGKDEFLQYVSDIFPAGNRIVGETKIDFMYKFAEREFCYPPKDTQQVIWDTFKEIPDDETSSCGFWGYQVIAMIAHDSIEPRYLAAKLNGDTETGNFIIDRALKSNNEETLDDCARRILRSLCNPAPRGKRIVFNDFYLGKAYWRWRWSKKMSEHIGLQFEKILTILNAEYYGEFSAKMHTGRSYISDENILGGLLLYLDKATTKKITAKTLGKIIDRMSYLSVWKAIELQEPSINKKEIQKISRTIK